MRRKGLLGLALLLTLIIAISGSQVVPTAISPGQAKGVAVVSQACPTFSWTSVDWAVSYRIAVFEALGVAPVSYEQMAAGGSAPVLTKEIEGRGLSWTPSSEEGLPGGGMYVWFVEAISPSGHGVWSSGRMFIVSEGTSAADTDERVTKILRERGVREEVITDVVKEMKSGGAGALSGDTGSISRGRVGTMGTEGGAPNYNTFYGLNAGAANTTGYYNAFIGYQAGNSNTTGSLNTFLGYNAGKATITGSSNTFIGYNAGGDNTGIGNTFVGSDAGWHNTSGFYNTFMGLGAGSSNTTGNSNTFIGDEAGRGNTTGNNNVFLGLEAGHDNTTGYANNFIGYRAGWLNTSGSENTFLGHHAGNSNTTANWNTFLGYFAGKANTTGYENTLIGHSAGTSNTTGDNNTFLGYEAGQSNSTADGNTFIGSTAGQDNTTGGANAFLGSATGRSNTTGYSNTFIGSNAGHENSTGKGNTFLGRESGNYNIAGNNNTYVGMAAGYNATGSGNVFVGYQTGYSEAGSNKLNIDNSSTSTPLIYGEFDNKILAVNGLFAVGTKTPAYPMELKTTGRNATFILQRSDGGALNFMNATSSYGQFGTGNNYPVRIQVNNAWKLQLNADNSLAMANGASCTAGGVWTNASSRELKENIADLAAEKAEATLAGLSPVTYSYKTDKAEHHVGFIAEDVPELVASKDRKSISPMDVVAVLTKVVQEQQKTIAKLEIRMAELEKKGNQAK